MLETYLIDNLKSNLYSDIQHTLNISNKADIAVAFLKKSGFNLIREPLEAFVDTGGNLRLLTGISFQQTDIDVLDEIGKLKNTECKIRYFQEPSSYIFHPKLYILKSPTKINAFIGSSNFTEGGFLKNVELNLKISGKPSEKIFSQINNFFNFQWENPLSIPVTTSLKKEYLKVKQARTITEEKIEREYEYKQALKSFQENVIELIKPHILKDRNYWLLTTTLENYNRCVKYRKWGDINYKNISKINPGDIVTFYVKGQQILGGIALVKSKPYESYKRIWPDRLYLYKIDLDFLFTPIPIDFRELVSDLNFIKRKNIWGTYLQGFSRQISAADFNIMLGRILETI